MRIWVEVFLCNRSCANGNVYFEVPEILFEIAKWVFIARAVEKQLRVNRDYSWKKMLLMNKHVQMEKHSGIANIIQVEGANYHFSKLIKYRFEIT